MTARHIERAGARRLYERFCKEWRVHARGTGRYGKPGVRKPTFSQWVAMHERNRQMMEQSSPADTREFMQAMDDYQDPWANDLVPEAKEPVEERGVVTIPMVGGDSDG